MSAAYDLFSFAERQVRSAEVGGAVSRDPVTELDDTLDRLESDIEAGIVVPIDCSLVERIRELVEHVEIDLDTPLLLEADPAAPGADMMMPD